MNENISDGMPALGRDRRPREERPRRAELPAATAADSERMFARSSVSDTTEVTPGGERRAEIVRHPIVGLLDRCRADAARAAPVDVRIEQPGIR